MLEYRLSRKQREKIVILRRQGISCKLVAERFGIYSGTVTRVCAQERGA